MKKVKMLVSVVLVMAVMLSTFLMPASAATIEDNAMEPRAAMLWCPECGMQRATYVTSKTEVLSSDTVYYCDFQINAYHEHEVHRTYDVLRCPNCGLVEDDINYPVYCTAFGFYI